MIEKIIANGLSAAALAALDVAIKLGLDYKGWCRNEAVDAERYHLDRIPDASYDMLIEKAVESAEGSLYFVHHQRTSLEVEKHKKIALKLNKPFLLLDLVHERGFTASQRIAVWISENQIRTLHVDGEKETHKNSALVDSVTGILEATFFLAMMKTGVTSPLQSIVQQERLAQSSGSAPQSMKAALDHLEGYLSLKDKATIANMDAEELASLHFTLGDYINTHFDLFTTNTVLLADCRVHAGRNELAPADAAAIIIRQLWMRLRDTCKIRIIK